MQITHDTLVPAISNLMVGDSNCSATHNSARKREREGAFSMRSNNHFVQHFTCLNSHWSNAKYSSKNTDFVENNDSTITLKYLNVSTLWSSKKMALLNQGFFFDMNIIFKINKLIYLGWETLVLLALTLRI